MRPEAVYLISDAHLGAEVHAGPERADRLHAFLESLPGRAGTLVVAGDLFDFWFEYRTAIPRRHFATLARLRTLRAAGIEIHYLTGNHDFWLGHFLAEEMGIRTHDGALTLETQGRRLWIHHGDGLVGGDLGYRILKRVLRHRASIALYGLLHPDLGIPLALRVSRWSRGSRGEKPLEPGRLWREIALPRFAEGYDAVLVGHFHHAYERREDGRELVLLGDWIDRCTYAVLEGGRIRLERWADAREAAPASAAGDAVRTPR
jgi:UDP-2,3-diacylglucosamine hydrolase